MTTIRMASLALAVLLAAGLSACASQKEPAEQAVANIDQSLQAVAEKAQKYLPEEFAAASARVDGLKQSLAAEDYSGIVEAAPGIAAEVRKLVADATIRKAQVKYEMGNEWVELVKTMPALIASVDNRIVKLSGGRLPKGMSRDAFKETVASFDAAKETWGKAADAGNGGDAETAVLLAREARVAIDQAVAAFGS